MIQGQDSRDDRPSFSSSFLSGGMSSWQSDDLDGIESRVISADESGVISGVVTDEVAELFATGTEESYDDRPTDLIIDELLAVGESLAAKYAEFDKFGSFKAEEPRDNVKTKLEEVMKSLNGAPSSSRREQSSKLPSSSRREQSPKSANGTPLRSRREQSPKSASSREPTSSEDSAVGLPAASNCEAGDDALETPVSTPLVESKEVARCADEKDDIETSLVESLSISNRDTIQILVPTPAVEPTMSPTPAVEPTMSPEPSMPPTPAVEPSMPPTPAVEPSMPPVPSHPVQSNRAPDTSEPGLPESGVLKASNDEEKCAAGTPDEESTDFFKIGFKQTFLTSLFVENPFSASEPKADGKHNDTNGSSEDLTRDAVIDKTAEAAVRADSASDIAKDTEVKKEETSKDTEAKEEKTSKDAEAKEKKTAKDTVVKKKRTWVKSREDAKVDSKEAKQSEVKTENADKTMGGSTTTKEDVTDPNEANKVEASQPDPSMIEPVRDWFSSLNIDFSAFDPAVLTKGDIVEPNLKVGMPNKDLKEANEPVQASKGKDDKPVGESSKDKTSTKKKATKEKLKSQKNNPTMRSRAMNFIKSRLHKNPTNQNGAKKQNNGDKAISQPPSQKLEAMRNKVEEKKPKLEAKKPKDKIDSPLHTKDVQLTGGETLDKKREKKAKKKAKKEKKAKKKEEKAKKKARKASAGTDNKKFKKKESTRRSHSKNNATYETAGCEKGDFTEVVGLIHKDIREVAGDVGTGVRDFFGIVCVDGEPSMSISEHTSSSFSSDDSSKSDESVSSNRSKPRKASAVNQRKARAMKSRAISPIKHKSMKSIRSPSPMRQGTMSPIRQRAITPLEPLSERSSKPQKLDHGEMSMLASSASSESHSIIEAKEPQYEREHDTGRDFFFVECKRCDNACDDRDFDTYASNSSGSLDDSLQIDVPKVLAPRRLQTKEVSEKRVAKKDIQETKTSRKKGKKAMTAPRGKMQNAGREFKIRESKDDHFMNPVNSPERLDLENISTLTDLQTFADVPSPTKRKGGVKKLFGLVRRKNKDNKLAEERDIFENLANRSEKKVVSAHASEKFGKSLEDDDDDLDDIDEIDETTYHSELSERSFSVSESAASTTLHSMFEYKANESSYRGQSHRTKFDRRSPSPRRRKNRSDRSESPRRRKNRSDRSEYTFESESPRRRRVPTFDSEAPRRRVASDFDDSTFSYY